MTIPRTVISSGDLNCEYGLMSGTTGFGACIGSGTWTLNVWCNFDPFDHAVTVTQYGGTVTQKESCWQGVNRVAITF
jgi:hypothetical protein